MESQYIQEGSDRDEAGSGKVSQELGNNQNINNISLRRSGIGELICAARRQKQSPQDFPKQLGVKMCWRIT